MKTNNNNFIGKTINFKLFGNIYADVFELFREFTGKVIDQDDELLILDNHEAVCVNDKILKDLSSLGISRRMIEDGTKDYKIEIRMN